MNTTVPSVTLQTAVLMLIKEFASINQTFSVHDVTRTIRAKTLQGELEIPEVEVAGASFRFDIPHVKVKGIFDELWRTGVFDPAFTLDRKFNGNYYEYTPQSTGVVHAIVPTFAPAAPVSTVSLGVPTQNTTVSTNDMDRIKLYLGNCAIRNFRPTIKKVQSAIKRDGVPCCSCDDLKGYITILGYSIVDDPEAVSKSQIVV